MLLREGLFCPCQQWCAQSITEHCFRRRSPRHGWWHVLAMARVGTAGHTEEVYWYSEPHPPLLSQSWGREVPAGSCAGSEGPRHRAPTLPLCLSWLKRPRQPKTALISHPSCKGSVLDLLFTGTSPSDRAPHSWLAEATGSLHSLPPIQIPALKNGSATATDMPGSYHHKQFSTL